MATATPLAENPKLALEAFLNEIERDYLPWYARSLQRIYWSWMPLHLIALFSGFATAIIAALVPVDALGQFGIGRMLLVLLPALGAAVSTVVVQSRLHEWCQLRETGRREIQNTLNEGRMHFAAATTPKEFSQIHDDLVKKVNAIEETQGLGWFSLAASRVTEGGK